MTSKRAADFNNTGGPNDCATLWIVGIQTGYPLYWPKRHRHPKSNHSERHRC